MRQFIFTLEIHTSIRHVLFIFSVIKVPKTVDVHLLVNQSTLKFRLTLKSSEWKFPNDVDSN